jgi:hypothetical protein
MTATQKLIARIEAFMAKHQMNRRRFGVNALNDPNFFYDLKAGRRTPTIETAQKIEDYMASFEKPKRKAGAA